MKYVINGKNKLLITERARKTLFYCCSWLFKIFQKIRHLENCIRKYFIHSVTTWNQLVASAKFEPTTMYLISKHLTSVRLGTKWLWVWISLLSLKRQIWRLLQARSSLTFRQTIECGFTLKLVCDIITTYNHLVVWKMSSFWKSNKLSVGPFLWHYKVIVPVISHKTWLYGVSLIWAN